MSKKVIIDCDPGIDDAVALTMALFDPRLEVVAITPVAGNVSAEQATLNVQTLVEQLDPPRFPRVGVAAPPDDLPYVDGRSLHGPDGLGGAALAVSRLARQHPAEKLICDEVRAAPGDVTILALGPLTNIARALARDPELATMIGRIIIRGGSIGCVGNVTPCAEFNIYCDPASAQAVFRSPTTKTLVPLDVTDQIVWSLDLLNQLPSEHTRAGKLLRQLLPALFRSYRQELGQERIRLADAVAVAAVLHPELLHTHDLAGDVETTGQLTTGATIFDRRPNAPRQTDMEVALEIEVAAVADCLVRGLAEAGKQT
ncbi:MAG: nucleoside hydrolase [Pirellulaceae bacterium]|nr:nucleoside hydrolase [Pirellulaceae bacterium]